MAVRSIRISSGLFQAVIIASTFSVALASLFVMQYLFTFASPDALVLDIVLQSISGTPPDFDYQKFLFIVISRFMLVFGISWLPLSLFTWIIQRNSS